MKLISTHMCKEGDCGYHGNLFGGLMLAWLDEAAVAFACELSDTPRMVTVSMDKVEFLKPVRPGQVIKIYGRLVGFGETSCTVSMQARRYSVYNGTEKVVCQTNIKFVRVDGDGEAIPIAEHVKEKHKKALL